MSPLRQRERRRLVKGAALLVLLAAAGCYLWRAVQEGHFHPQSGGWLLRTGDYQWFGVPGQGNLLAMAFGAALLIWLGGLWPRAWAVRTVCIGSHRAAGVAMTAVLWSAGIGLATLEWFGYPALDFAAWCFFVLLGTAAAWLALRPQSLGGPCALQSVARRLARPAGCGTFIFFCALGTALAILAWQIIYRGQPLVTDSESQIAQARLLLSGHWRLEISQTLRDVISFPYATTTVPSFSQYPPGHIFVILPFLAAGLPAQAWTVLAAGLTAGFTALLAGRIAGGAAARAAGLLIAASPFFLALGGEPMNHMTAALALVLVAWCWMPAGAVRSPRRRLWLAWLGGFALAWAVATRPATGAAQGFVWGCVWLLLWLGAARRARGLAPRPDRTRGALGRFALAVALGLMIPTAILLFYNRQTTGHALEFGYTSSNPEMHRLGFRADGPYPYTLTQAINNLAANICSLNFVMFGWATGSWVLLGIWWLRSRFSRAERVMAALIAAQTFAYFLYHFHDLFIGPRFLFELLPLGAVLAAMGLAATLRRGDARAGALWGLLALFSIAAVGAGLDFWQIKFNPIVARHVALDTRVRAHEPLAGPTVFIVPSGDEEMIGRYFAPATANPPRWFISAQKEAAARALPELKGYAFIPLY